MGVLDIVLILVAYHIDIVIVAYHRTVLILRPIWRPSRKLTTSLVPSECENNSSYVEADI